MKYKIFAPENVNATINLPTSKSISNRALIIKALSHSPYSVENLSECDDTRVMIDTFESETNMVDVKAAGTAMRFLTAYLSRKPGDWIITGTKRMQQRPINLLVDALISLGARIEYLGKSGFPPLQIKGSALDGGEISLSGGISSQFISALLMIAPTMSKGIVIHLQGDVISVPYIKLTLGMMSEFGVESSWEGSTISIYPQEYKPIQYKVEADWSAASYWYEMAALSQQSVIELKGLSQNSMQGDSKVAELFLDLGIKTEYTHDGIILTKTEDKVKKMFHNFLDEPDLAQTFAVTCCMMDIPFIFTGLQTLKIKETDRIEALKVELRKLGYILHDRDNSILEWNGERCQPEFSPIIKTYEDHRMAMAFAPAAFKIENLMIDDPEVVTKSYPNYWLDLEQAGFRIVKGE